MLQDPARAGRRPEPLVWGGVVGPALFVAVFLVDGAMRAGYDPLRHQVSYLSLGDGGWVQVASFLMTGVLIVAFAAGMRRVLVSGAGAVGAVGAVGVPIALGLVGAGLLVAGVFPTVPAFGFPPGTPDSFPTEIPASAYLHLAGAFAFFGGMAAACLAMARRFRAAGASSWATGSLAAAIAVLVFLAASSADPSGRPFVPALAGLLQRLSIVAGLGWIAAVAARTLRGAAW